MESQNIDDMDSLFEGMVLFTPQVVHNSEANAHSDAIHSEIDNNPETPSSVSSASMQQLDENLFSDLIVNTPSHIEESKTPMPSDPYTKGPSSTVQTGKETAFTSSVFRQSTRKKKRTGLRIGYGRDAQEVDDPEPLPIHPEPLDIPHSPLPTATVAIQTSSDTREVLPSLSNHLTEVDSPSTVPSNEYVVEPVNNGEPLHSEQMNEDKGLNLTGQRSVTPDAIDNEELHTVHQQEKEVGDVRYDSVDRKYEQIKVQISEKLRLAQDQASSTSSMKKESRKTRRKAAKELELASVRYREIEKKLEEACEAEDFERADQLSESLAAAEKEKESLRNALREAELECDIIDAKMQEAIEHQIATEEECASLLLYFSKDAVTNVDSVLEDVEVNSSTQLDEWFMSVEATEAKKWELDIELQLVDEARSTLNGTIHHLAESDIKEKEVLCEKKELLALELENLLRLVREKEAEIADNDSKIDTVEKRIAEVVSGFKDVQTELDVNHLNLQSVLSQIESEREILWKKKQEIDDLLCQGKNKGEELRKLATASVDEANMYQKNLGLRRALLLSVLKVRDEKLGLAEAEEKILVDVQILRREISDARSSLQELSSQKSTIQQENAALKQRMLFIDKRVPELEAEKKVAATARNFKEAARIASEAKSLTAEKEHQQIKMEEFTLELGKLEEEINQTTHKLLEFEELISLKEKEAAMARYQRLRLVSAAASSERKAALDLGDIEEANVLLAEAEAADSEAKQLQEMHNISEVEFGNLSMPSIPMELVFSLDGEQLEELAAGCNQSPS